MATKIHKQEILKKQLIITEQANSEINIFVNFLNETFATITNTKLINSSMSFQKNFQKTTQIRNRNLSISDVLYYLFQYTNIHATESQIIKNINADNGTNICINSYKSKISNLPVEILKQAYDDIKLFYYNRYTKTTDDIQIIGIDGTTTNLIENGKLLVSLNMGYYDISNGLPIEINECGHFERNKEVKNAIKYINCNKNKFEKKIITCDRFYTSKNFFECIENNNAYCVCRIKDNYKGYNNFDIYNNSIDNTKYIATKHSKKHNKVYELKITSDIRLITNLPKDKYTKKDILNIYNKRWDIETFFGCVKKHFKFQYINTNDNNKREKIYYCIQIILFICKSIERIYTTYLFLQNNKNKKMNQTDVINGVYYNLLKPIINCKLTTKDLELFFNNYCGYVNSEKGRHFKRKSIKPFTKGYVKFYSNKSFYQRILHAILHNTIDKLNKNAKLIANKSKINKIVFITKSKIKKFKKSVGELYFYNEQEYYDKKHDNNKTQEYNNNIITM